MRNQTAYQSNHRWLRLVACAALVVLPTQSIAVGAASGGTRRTKRIRSIQGQHSLPVANDEQHQRELKVNGPLDVLHRVWNDAANQQASDVESDCIKVKKGKGSIKGSNAPSVSYAPSLSPAPTKSIKSPKSSKYCQDRPTGALPSAPSMQSSAAPSPESSNLLVPPSAEAPQPPAAQPSPTTNDLGPPQATPTTVASPVPASTPSEIPAAPTTPQQQPPPPQTVPSSAPAATSAPVGGTSPTTLQPPSTTIPTLVPESPTTTSAPPPPAPTAPDEPTAAQPPQPPQGGGGGSNGDNSRCAQVADETLVTNATDSATWRLEIEVKLAATTDVETALQEMQRALQAQVAPTLTNCASIGSGESAQRHLQEDTGVQNVVFGPRSAREFVTCQDQASSDSICLNTAGRVTAYGSSVPDTFSDDLSSAVQSADFSDVEGLQEVSTVTAKAGGDPVAEGSGIGNEDDRTDGGGDSVIEEPKSNVSPTDGAISAGAAVGIALAALVVLLCAMFAYRGRRRRGYDRRDAALKLANTEDEDDLIFPSGGEGSVPDDEDDRIPGTRKVHVLDEDDSLVTANHSLYRDRNVEIRPVRVPYDESNDQHSSIKFVATAGARVRPSPTIPPDASRTYAADDTVLL